DAAGLVPDFQELELAPGAVADDPAGDPDLRPLRAVVGERGGGQLPDGPDGGGVVEPVAPRVDPEGFDLAELGEADLGEVLGFVGHGGCSVGWWCGGVLQRVRGPDQPGGESG